MKKRICFRIKLNGDPKAYGMSIELELKDGSTYDPETAGIDKVGLLEAVGLNIRPDQIELIAPERFDAEFSPDNLEEFYA